MADERQMREQLQHIEPMHLQRYLWAAEHIRVYDRVLDIACGCGYGSFILALKAEMVHGVDRAQEAVEFAEKHYCVAGVRHRVVFRRGLATDDLGAGTYDAVVSLETIEHLTREDGMTFLANVHKALRENGLLLLSGPEIGAKIDRDVVTANEFHLFEHTRDELTGALKDAGFRVEARRGQRNGYLLNEGDTSSCTFSLWTCRKAY